MFWCPGEILVSLKVFPHTGIFYVAGYHAARHRDMNFTLVVTSAIQ